MPAPVLPSLAKRPEAKNFEVGELLQLVRTGRIRLPAFQRGWKWKGDNVYLLIDSLVNGYPVGNLLLWRRPAPAATVVIGPHEVSAAAADDALWVVDGQQRITSLAGVLMLATASGRPPDPGSPFALGYDLDTGKVVRLRGRGGPPHCVPLAHAGDGSAILSWLATQPWMQSRPDLVQRAIALSDTLRTWKLPAYVVESDTDAPLRVIFKRMNTTGVAMTASEVFDALHGAGDAPGSLRNTRALVAALGFGDIQEDVLLRAFKATYTVEPATIRPDEMERISPQASLAELFSALRNTIRFLREEAQVPSVAWLPYRLPLWVLARFFHHFPSPHPRNELLLTRWFWRGCLAGTFGNTSNPRVRGQLAAIVAGDESGSVQRLLSLVPAAPLAVGGFRALVASNWRSDAAAARIVGRMLLELEPRDPSTGAPIDVVSHESEGAGSLGPLLAGTPHGAANRSALAQPLASILDWAGADPAAALTHGIDAAALEAARQGDLDAFFECRENWLANEAHERFGRRAGWDESDRPPLSSILAVA